MAAVSGFSALCTLKGWGLVAATMTTGIAVLIGGVVLLVWCSKSPHGDPGSLLTFDGRGPGDAPGGTGAGSPRVVRMITSKEDRAV